MVTSRKVPLGSSSDQESRKWKLRVMVAGICLPALIATSWRVHLRRLSKFMLAGPIL